MVKIINPIWDQSSKPGHNLVGTPRWEGRPPLKAAEQLRQQAAALAEAMQGQSVEVAGVD